MGDVTVGDEAIPYLQAILVDHPGTPAAEWARTLLDCIGPHGADDNADPFGLGATRWPGLAKLMEEAAEVIQIGAKLVATGGNPAHWSGDDLTVRLQQEVGDLLAAIRYFRDHNREFYTSAIGDRMDAKFGLFQQWDQQTRRARAEDAGQ